MGTSSLLHPNMTASVPHSSRRSAFVALALALALVASTSAARAQSPAQLAARTDVRATLDALKSDNAWTLEQQIALCEIPAPPF